MPRRECWGVGVLLFLRVCAGAFSYEVFARNLRPKKVKLCKLPTLLYFEDLSQTSSALGNLEAVSSAHGRYKRVEWSRARGADAVAPLGRRRCWLVLDSSPCLLKEGSIPSCRS